MVGRLESFALLGGCEGKLVDEIRSQFTSSFDGSGLSSWISSSLHEYSSRMSLNGWHSAKKDDDLSSWKIIDHGNSPSTPPKPTSKVLRVKYSPNRQDGSLLVRTVRALDRKESFKRTPSPQDASKDRRYCCVKLAADARKRKKDSRLIQRRALASASTLITNAVSSIDTHNTRTSKLSGNSVVVKPVDNSEPNKQTKKQARVCFNLEKVETVVVPRVDPNDKTSLYYSRKNYRAMNSDEEALFHCYHFYLEMYDLEKNAKTKEALRRRMSSIANAIFGIPSRSTPRRKTPKKTKRKPYKLPLVQRTESTMI